MIDLLNKIHVDNGGAGGGLGGNIVAGLASEPLYKSILRFQKTHYPTQTGFVEPRSKMFEWMQILSTPQAKPPTPAPAAPRTPGQWSALSTQSVRTALRAALDDDMRVSHSEAVNIIRATLSDGVVSQQEIDDLNAVATKAKSLTARSRFMLNMLVNKLKMTPANKGPFELVLEKHRLAAGMACDFLERSGGGRFSNLDRDDIGTGLLMRIGNPGMLNQDKAGLCGPASFIFNLAYDNPVAYARFAIDLFEKGEAKIHRWKIEPGSDLRDYKPPYTMDHVDWMTMASIRDSENFFFDYEDVGDNGGSTASEVARWFIRAGYTDVRDETSKSHASVDVIDSANRLFAQGYRVCLFVGSNMLKAHKQSTQIRMNHAVVQRSAIDRTGGKIKLKVFTWGQGYYEVPNGAADLSLDDFLQNFYGYVAGKPY